MDPLTKTHTVRLILGDQLNRNHSWFKRVDPGVVYVFMEVRQETDYVTHHIQKIAAFFAAMRAFADELRAKGHRVIYMQLDAPDNQQGIEANLRKIITREQASYVEYQFPDEWRLDVEMSRLAGTLPVKVRGTDTEHFLTSRQDLADHFQGKKQYLMESFYREMRKRTGVLMENGKPTGGKWNYDRENRNRYDGKLPIPAPKSFGNDVRHIVAMIHEMGVDTIGTADPDDFTWPCSRKQSLSMLRYFTRHLLPGFGTYQDAMTEKHWSLFHSRLSFSLNTKMISPQEVIDAAVREWEQRRVGLAQVEGFVRQILGWREYVRGIYWSRMPAYAECNHFSHRRPLPSFYWNGNTRMQCVRYAVAQSLRYAYAHHIQRLMVTGNFALLAGVAPDEVDRWYLGIYIDAIEWVEIVNTRGMSQFADGGIVATKPYVSSAAYVHRMSDYCGPCPYDHRKRHGESACPFNSLYWAFLDRNRDHLGSNARMGMMYRTWDRMAPAERGATLAWAAHCLEDVEAL